MNNYELFGILKIGQKFSFYDLHNGKIKLFNYVKTGLREARIINTYNIYTFNYNDLVEVIE